MSQGAYPISRLIANILAQSGLSREEFVRHIGCPGRTRGLRRLDEWLRDGIGDSGFLNKIVEAFPPDPLELELALFETDRILQAARDGAAREREARARRRFRPFIWVHTVNGAQSFFSALAERQIKLLRLRDEFLRLAPEEQLAEVRQRIVRHYQDTRGRFTGFGAILAYRFANSFDSSIVLAPDGAVLEENGPRLVPPEVWASL